MAQIQSSILSIAGSDNSGGAGIQADIKTACAFKVYAATAVSAVTAQNPHRVYGVEPVSATILESQIRSICEVMHPDAVKIGMLPTADSVRIVSRLLKEYELQNIVIDPVMIASTGDPLSAGPDKIRREMINLLFPMAEVITPNIKEAEFLLDDNRATADGYEKLCTRLHKELETKAVLLKGGHASDMSVSTDLLYDGDRLFNFRKARIMSENLHGTGCVLSTAIACGLALNLPLHKAVRVAKDFISQAIEKGKDIHIMSGNGPLWLF